MEVFPHVSFNGIKLMPQMQTFAMCVWVGFAHSQLKKSFENVHSVWKYIQGYEAKGPARVSAVLTVSDQENPCPQNLSFPAKSFPAPRPALHSWITIPCSSGAKQTLIALHASFWLSWLHSVLSPRWPAHISFWPENPFLGPWLVLSSWTVGRKG